MLERLFNKTIQNKTRIEDIADEAFGYRSPIDTGKIINFKVK